MNIWLLFAEVPPGGEGITGWVTAVATVGLLGPVLYWLMNVHLPAKDKQIMELLDRFGKEREADRGARHSAINDFQRVLTEMQVEHTKEIVRYDAKLESISGAARVEIKEARKEFKTALDAILVHCQEESRRMTDAFKGEMAKMVASVTVRGGGSESAGGR